MVVAKHPRILLVGGGLTSAAIASSFVGRMVPVELVVWDKASRPGGRLTTHRAPNMTPGQVDLGAQYISASRRYLTSHDHFYSDWVDNGLLKPLLPGSMEFKTSPLRKMVGEEHFQDGVPIALDDKMWELPDNTEGPVNLVRTNNFVAPSGTESIVNHLWSQSGLKVLPLHGLHKLDFEGGSWVAWARGARYPETFDSVVTTLPIPQLLGENPAPEGKIGGNFLDLIFQNKDIAHKLALVKFNSIFSLGLFYDQPLDLGLRWTAKYFVDDPVIRYVAVDSLKRGQSSSRSQVTPTSIVVQSQVSYAMEHLAKTKQDMVDPLLSQLGKLVPGLPPPSDIISHKWRYSQTSRPYPGNLGCVVLARADSGPLVAAGDSFTHSNVDGCLSSALSVVDTIIEELDL